MQAMMRLLVHLKYFVCSVAAVAFLFSTSVVYGADKAAAPGKVSGTVVETMDAASYTYVQVDTGKEKIWAAAPQFAVKAGDKVSFAGGVPMENFQSKALNRTFKMVYFVGHIETPDHPAAKTGQDPRIPNDAAHAGLAPKMGPGAQGIPNDATHAGLHGATAKTPAAAIDFSGIKKADGGLTVAEVYQQKGKLEKKPITFRGKVVKYNAQIMNKNWLHVQDGTGASGANDVTVTTDDTAQVGDTVLVKGTVALDKDFGYGYKYGIVVENAKVTVEKAK